MTRSPGSNALPAVNLLPYRYGIAVSGSGLTLRHLLSDWSTVRNLMLWLNSSGAPRVVSFATLWIVE
jgi:hypothetical protein